MDEPLEVNAKDLSGSRFKEADMSATVFSDINLEKATFVNINLRGASFSAVDFGGAKFECVNTGEDRPQEPVTFEGVEFDDSAFRNCVFSGVKLIDCELKGMTIDGIPVVEMIMAYKRNKRDSVDSLLGSVLSSWFKGR